MNLTLPRQMRRVHSINFIVVALLLVSMILAACGEPDPSLESPQTGQSSNSPSGRILFVADGNIMLWNNGNISRLTGGVQAASPSWAPAGERFAYIQVHDAFSDVVVARSNGETLVVVTEGHDPPLLEFTEEYVENAAWARDVHWSPVGEQLIYVSDKGGFDQYSRPLFLWYSETFAVGPYLLNASASIGVTQESPVLSPDGNQVAFVVRNEYGLGARVSEIWLLDLNTATRDMLVTSDSGSYQPEWSPDGRNLVYVQRTGHSNDIWIAPVDGSDPYVLIDSGRAASPIWSRDGRFIAYFQESGGEFQARYVEISEDADGRVVASESRELFSHDNVDAPSGMSWYPN